MQASGLPTVSEMQMDSVGPPDTSSSPTTPAALIPSRTATAGAEGACVCVCVCVCVCECEVSVSE